MHDEFERAVTGDPPRKGLSPLGWMVAIVGLFMVVGIFAAGWAVTKVAQRARHMAAELVSELRPGDLAAAMVTNLRDQEGLVDLPPQEGLRWLRDMRSGDPAEAMLERLVTPARQIGDRPERTSRGSARGEASDRSLTLHSDDGDVRFDLTRDEDGARLVIGSNDGQVRLNLRRTGNGGFLTIDSEDGSARVDLVRTAQGGMLTIESDEGTVRIDATGGEDGAKLEIHTDDGRAMRLGLGDAAVSTPSWVPRFDGMPDAPRPVYSLEGEQGQVGGVAWTSDEDAVDVLEAFRAQLEGDGYDVMAEFRGRDAGRAEGALWARDEAAGRFVYVITRERDGGTRVMVGFGARD